MKLRLLQFLLGLLPLFALAQTNPTDKIPVDPKLKIGKLSNGLTYYIRQNKKPEQKVELRLVVNAGSVLEDEDQQGLAHLSEHMAFNGTTHFKKNDIISFLQSIGVTFGNDLNAYTSFDETVYILPIPTDKPGNLEKGFQILEDWAHNVTDRDEDIDNEKAIVLEESRLGKGADDRIFRKIYPRLFEGSKYADRLPIGIDSIVRTAKYESLRRFYREWYRPDLMAVIVVGDIEPAKAEELVKKYFSGLTNPVNKRERTVIKVPAYSKSSGMVVTDKEATNYSVQLNYSATPEPEDGTLGNYRQGIIKNIFITLLNQRLQELTQKQDPPYVYAGTSFGSYARGYEAFNAEIRIAPGNALRGLEAFVAELERVKQFGFTAAELERVKKSFLSQMESFYQERDKTESADLADEYIRNFLTQEPIPGIAKEFDYFKLLLPQIGLAEVNAVAERLKQNSNKLVTLTGPETNSGELPTGEQLLAKVAEVEKKEINPYKEKTYASSLLATLPRPGKIVSSAKNTKLGTTELKLSNGVSVTLKPTDFKNDEVLLSAIRPGGKNIYGLKDKYSAEYAVSVVRSMGIAGFTPLDLQRVLAGKSASASPSFSATTEGISGNSTVKDIETMLQLVYLYFTAPRKDTSLFNSFVQKNKSQVTMMGANPQVYFVDTLYKVLYRHNPLATSPVPRPENFDKIDLDRVMQIYRERFGNAYGMHFTLVGSFKEEQLKPLLEKYLAALPATPKKFGYKDNGIRPLKGNVTLAVNRGAEQKAYSLVIYHGEIPFSQDMKIKAEAISEILNIRILEELREKIQGVYDASIYPSFEKLPYPNYSFIAELPSGPEKVDTLLAALHKEINDLKANGPSAGNLAKVKQQWREKYKVDKKENGYWLGKLQEGWFPGNDPRYFLEYEKYINALTVTGIRDAARLLFNEKNVITAILRPGK